MKTQITTTKIKFEECLNDLFDYFLLGDPVALLNFKQAHQLPDDLLTEFTTNISADEATENGIIIPLSKIHNYPYTVYFNFSDDIELLKPGNDLQHRQGGYCLKIESTHLFLYTIPYLKDYSPKQVERLMEIGKKGGRQFHTVENGWYQVEILAGQTKQEAYFEPTIEFLLTHVVEKPSFTAQLNYEFSIRADQ